MEKYKFNPLKFGFSRIDDGDTYYVILKGNKVVAQLFYINYGQGLKCEWHLKKVIHTFDPTQTNEETLFYGKIPDDDFGKALLANVFIN